MTTAAAAPTFAPIPMRAYRDERLTLLDHRVLGAIAAHDRFNGNGQACWASNERLASVLGCHLKSVPRAITRLIQLGYVRDLCSRGGKQRTRSRFLTVIYNEEDRTAFQPDAKASEMPPAASDESEVPAAEQAPAPPKTDRASKVEGNLAGYRQGNRRGYPNKEGRNKPEGLGTAIGKTWGGPRPSRPPEHVDPLRHEQRQRQQRDEAELARWMAARQGISEQEAWRIVNATPSRKARAFV